MNQYFRLTNKQARALAKQYGTPLLVVSTDEVEKNYTFLQKHLPNVKLYYAVKANPEPNIVRTLARLGACFDVASDGEMAYLQDMGIDGERMIYANPIKTMRGLAMARKTKIRTMTFDNISEIDKMASVMKGAQVLLRVRVDNPRALVDLNKKFGAHPSDAMALLQKAREAGLDAAGLCFHVGSQSLDAAAYLEAIRICRALWDEAAADGFDMRVLDIGGGMPIPALNMEIDTEGMLREITSALTEAFPDTEIWAEPGRFLCGTTVNLITSVIGMQQRGGNQWYFLDDGIYGTFSAVLFDHWDFELDAGRGGEMIPATFAGPSCDSLDIMFRDKMTVPLTMGDVLLTPVCGAYTSASATVFNGFDKARYGVWEEIQNTIE